MPGDNKKHTYGPEETVASFMKQLETQEKFTKKYPERYKPTAEEEAIIKQLTAPLLAKIAELLDEVQKMPIGPERFGIEQGIGNLLDKYLKLRVPQKMTKEEIKNLTFLAVSRQDVYNDMPQKPKDKIEFLQKEIDFLLQQLYKRLK